MVQMYRKKPIAIEAVQWDGTNIDAIMRFCPDATYSVSGLIISTLEGELHASAGDYIIRGVSGEFYPCKPDIFQATYDLVAG